MKLMIIAAVAGLTLAAYIVYKVTDTVKDVSSTVKKLAKNFEEQEIEYATTPKSVSGMTSILLPRIQADFPDLNYSEFKSKVENMLRSALEAITCSNISLLTDVSADLRDQIRLKISDNEAQGIKENFSDIKIHKTEITDYKKTGGTCVITLQTAIGYIHYKKKNGDIISGSDSLPKQSRYNTELVYVQDADLAGDRLKALGVNCPNCGAPVKSIGAKVCPYCGSGIKEINIRVWTLNRYYEL